MPLHSSHNEFSDELWKFIKAYLYLEWLEQEKFLFWLVPQVKRYTECLDDEHLYECCKKFADQLYKYPNHFPAKVKFRKYVLSLVKEVTSS